jgi:hypothetical protein
MSRNLAFLFASCVFSLAFVSCATMKSIDKIEGVTAVDWELMTSERGAPMSPSALKPGERYYVGIRYLQEKNSGKTQWKRLSNTEGIRVSVDNEAFSASMPWITAPTDPFTIFKNARSTVTVQFPGSAFNDVSKDVSLSLPTALPSFRGKDGSNGDDSGSVMGWSSGYDGKDGGDGTNGQNVDLEIAHYNTKGTALASQNPLVIVRDAVTGRVWLLASGSSLLSIDVSGGSGGSGGKGADREVPDDSDEQSVRGGDGGDGGSGGSGGFVHVVLPAGSALGKSLNVLVDGGKGGKYGKGGSGDSKDEVDNFIDFLGAVVGVTEGRDGDAGSDGNAGRYIQETRDLSALFLGVTSPFFDRSRLEP